VDALAAELAGAPDVRVAVGRPGADVDGFRRSHLDAATTQQMLARLTSPQQVARFSDVQLVALLTSEPTRVEEFLTDTLGGLLTADADTRETVLTYVRELGNSSRTAQRLFTHRNTVLRRLARADELLARPLAENVLAVAAALEVLRWRGTP
jgi:DNA-binding PucR family transcriptional regulator